MKKLIVIIFFLTFWAATSFGQVAVIAHDSVSVDKIDKSELLDFYTGDVKKWSDDVPVVVFDLKPKEGTRKIFYKFLGKSSSRMKSIWMKKMLSGEGDPPEAIESEEKMIEKVASTPGALGFVDKAKVNEAVKVLLLIEKKKK